MAEAVVAPLVGKLQEMVLSEMKALVSVNGDIRRLRDRMMWMQAFLLHTDPRRRDVSNELVGVWLKQTRDVAFDAEDALDHYFRRIDLSRYPTWTQSIIRFLAGLTTQVSVRHDLSRRIVEINLRLEDIIINKEKYNVEIESNKSAVLWKTSTNISTIPTNLENIRPSLIQRDELVGNLEKALHNENNDLSVIYVTGQSGVGKATLVRDIYESERTKKTFPVKIWQTFPALMNSSTILQFINQQLDERISLLSRKGIHKSVQSQLKGKGKFLVVIDGQLRNSDWNTILSALPDESNGSRVIRIVQGDEIRAAGEILVKPFEMDATIKLFSQMVQLDKHVGDEELNTRLSDNSTNIYEIAERVKNKEQNDPTKNVDDYMWAITRGLPLAVTLLSGLLKTREYPHEWQAVFTHLVSKQSKRLGSLLTTCFDDLPQDLKSCFLYFAAFPVNTPIEARKLVRLWMAEGFIRPRDGNTMENVGRIYLNELNSRHLVQLVKLDDICLQKKKFDEDDDIISRDEELVSIHHEVHQFLQLEAQEVNFVDIHNGYDIPYLTSARRLSLQNYTNKYGALANSMPKLRSILSNFIEEDEEDTRGSEQEMEQQMKENNKRVQKKHSGLDGNGEEQSIEVDGEEDDNIDGLRKLKDSDEGDKSIKLQQGKQNEISEQAKGNVKQSKRPWLGPWPGRLSYRGNGKKRQDYIKSYISETLQGSKFLRVVKLQGIEFGKKLPDTIGDAVHLQYLGVTGCSLEKIPSAVGKLKHLQTLDVQGTYVRELPQEFWRIRALRHVLGSGIYLPKRVGNLKHLQTLVKVLPDPNHNCWDSKTFERMLRLQSLYIEDCSEDAANLNELFAAIEKPNILEYLQTLVLHATTKFPMCIFTSSSQRRLRALELYGELDVTKLRSEKGKEETNICLPNLTTLSLEETKVTQDFMNYLANFPLLANLTLKQNSYKDTTSKLVFNSGGYKCLTKMTLYDLEDLEVQIMKSQLPVLTDLVILQSTQTQQLNEVKLVVYGEHEFLKTLQYDKIELHDPGCCCCKTDTSI